MGNEVSRTPYHGRHSDVVIHYFSALREVVSAFDEFTSVWWKPSLRPHLTRIASFFVGNLIFGRWPAFYSGKTPSSTSHASRAMFVTMRRGRIAAPNFSFLLPKNWMRQNKKQLPRKLGVFFHTIVEGVIEQRYSISLGFWYMVVGSTWFYCMVKMRLPTRNICGVCSTYIIDSSIQYPPPISFDWLLRAYLFSSLRAHFKIVF